jgi:hypothetical protein
VTIRIISKHLTFVLFLCACSGMGGKDEDSTRSAEAPGEGSVPVDAVVMSEADGVLQARVAVAVASPQVVRASQQSKIAGAMATFAPGAFLIDADVTIEPGATLATDATLALAGLKGRSIVAAGEAVAIYWSEDRDAAVPVLIAIPLPPQSTPLATAGAKLYVLYSANVVGSEAFDVGKLADGEIKMESGLVSFSRLSFGIYQAVYIAEAAAATRTSTQTSTQTSTKTASGTSTGTIGAGEDEYALPPPKPNPEKKKPTAFAITAPTDELSAKSIRIEWELSDFATSFDVTVASDAECKTDAKTTAGVEALTVVAEGVVNGDNFICVVANGEHGTTPASNNGFKFRADVEGPETPAAPTIALDGNIGIHVEWLPVQDSGEAGVARYGLEIATAAAKAKGEADVFNSEISDTTKDAIGFGGQTYYARVRAIDSVGNEGAWSAWSEALTIPQ